jgi:hypothetical protein
MCPGRPEPALPTIDELRQGKRKAPQLSLEEVLAEFSEGLLVAEKPMAALLFHFARLGSQLDLANHELFEGIQSMPADKLSTYASDTRAFMESNEWREMQSLSHHLLDVKVEVLNCMRDELGIAKGRTFLWKPEHFRK